jgi:hypothetical protein
LKGKQASKVVSYSLTLDCRHDVAFSQAFQARRGRLDDQPAAINLLEINQWGARVARECQTQTDKNQPGQKQKDCQYGNQAGVDAFQ